MPEASPLKTPQGMSAAAALRPSAQAALTGASAEQIPLSLDVAALPQVNPLSQRVRHARKSAPERLPIGLMQHRSWLMRGCEGGAVRGGEPFGGYEALVGDDAQPMSMVERALRRCLSLRARRWATYEFMTAAIDEPWLQQGTMAELLEGIGLGEVRVVSLAVDV